MLDEFENFFKARSQQLTVAGIRIEIKRRSQPTEALNIILETDSHIASISAWESGATDLDVLNLNTGECALAKRYDFQTTQEMLTVLEDVYLRIINNNLPEHMEVTK